MANKISYEGIGGVAATFLCREGVKTGQAVKLTEANTVGPCADGDIPCGVVLGVAPDGVCAVQVGGFVTVSAGEDVTVGLCELVSDGAGGVKKGSGTGGVKLVVSNEGGKAVIML